MRCEVAERADFSDIRYAQCWEDADILLQALEVQPGHTCLSIASAGDNTLALLSRGPARVVALDLSAAQLACLELRVAGYRQLSHPELLELLGSRPSQRRWELYQCCRPELAPAVRRFWDERPLLVIRGIGAAGKFERYLALFRRLVLPLAHRRADAEALLLPRPVQQRAAFYEQRWNTWRWRLLMRIFCARSVAGRLGRERSFFRYAEGGIGAHLLRRVRHALTRLDPASNPYLQWILTGQHRTALPYALRPENFEPIRAHLDRLEWRCQSLEQYLETCEQPIDRFNLSDIFEYMAPASYSDLLQQLVAAARPGARLVYWNMLVPRSRPDSLAAWLRPLDALARQLHEQDRAPFYSRFVVEEVVQSCKPGL